MSKVAGSHFGALGLVLLVSSSPSWAQPMSVQHDKGLLTIRCTNAPLGSVFESIRSQVGVELILEDEAKSTQLTANLTQVPVAMAIQRLLEGTGISYIVMMDPSDWGRVGKVFVGGSGASGESSRTARAPRRPVPSAPEPETGDTEEPYDGAEQETFDEATEALDAMDAGMDPSNMAGIDPNMESPELETPPENPGEFGGDFANPPGSSPIPDYLPPAQSFPRSNFTPGLPNGNNRRNQGGMAQPQEQNPANPPQAAYPFTDPFGRPIPVPPGMTTPQQQQQQQQQQRRQQQQQ